MKKVTAKVISVVLIMMTIISYIPINSFALESIDSGNSILPNSNNNIIRDAMISDNFNNSSLAESLYEDIFTLNYNQYTGNTFSFPTGFSLDFTKVLGINENNSLSELEDSLRSSGFVYKTKANNIVVNNNYSSNNSGESKVILHTPLFGHKIAPSQFFNENSYLKRLTDFISVYNVSEYDSISGVMFIKDDGENQFKIIIRYFIFDARNINGGPKEDSILYTIDYDFTPVIKEIISSRSNTSDYPVLDYLKQEYSNYYETVLSNLQNEQKKSFDYYRNFTSTFGNKDLIISINNYLSNDTVNSVSEVPSTITDSNLKTVELYSKALSKSNIYNFRIIDLLPDSTIDNVNGDSNITWFNSSGRTLNLLQAITEANAISDYYSRRPNPYSSKGIDSNAALFNDLVKYRYGKISGATERSLNSNASDERLINDRLESLLITEDMLFNKIISPSLWDQVSKLPKFSFGISYNDLMDLMTSIQMLEEYASVNYPMSGLEGDDDLNGSAKNLNLQKVINDNLELEEGSKEILEGTLATQTKTYIQIKEGLDYLGITPWTPNLKYIYDLYPELIKFSYADNFDEYDVNSDTEPLRRFFSFPDKTLSAHYMTGVALSATYIPMQTNLYDPTSIRVLKNEEWLRDFHMRYGFHRKALLMDTNVNAAVDSYVTGSRDTSKIATLGDLLQHNRDIVLYIDDNFYNTDEVAVMLDKVYERLSNTEQAGIGNQSFEGFFDNLFNNSIEHLLKTGPMTKYDSSTINNVTGYGKPSPLIDWRGLKESLFTNGLVMSSGKSPDDHANNEIKKGLDQRDYSIKQSYAAVSGIYRHKELANTLNRVAERPAPVFVSSPTLFNVQNVPDFEFNSIYNYYMLKNLNAAIGVDYRTTLDLDNPIYIDIYGNIITESGLVVIPAASNATLYPKNLYSPYNLGFMDLYSKGDNIKSSKKEVTDRLTYFILDEKSNKWLQRNFEFNNVPINPQRPSVADSALLEVLYDNQVSILSKKGYDFNQRIWLITEVLRGAPLENIDKTKEGIIGKRDISKYGLYMSWKLDEIADMLLPTTNGNSIISMPNLAFMNGIEYLVLFSFKLMLLLFVAYIMYRVYIDAVGGKLGLKTLYQCVSTIVTFTICISLIPSVISLSYNETNKMFLQNEIKYINLLNREKSLEGREISAVGVTEPKSQTKLYLKLDSVKVPWYKVLEDVMFAPIGTTLSTLYEEELQNNMLYGFEDVEVVNDGVYIDVDNIFNSSSIIYNNNQKFLYQNINTTPTTSYFIPYYYIMDNLLSSINIYNRDNGIINITTKIQSDGSVKTMGMIGDYLLSELFLLEAEDPLGLYDLYNIDTNERSTFISLEDYDDDYYTTKLSMWYVRDQYSPEDIASRIDQTYSHMRAYVANNREMIGRVTDETFIKTMMLDVSMKYNTLFRIPAAKGIEVFSIDSRDLIRLSLTSESDAVVNSAHSFGKFVYEQSGSLGVILTTVLLGIYFIASIVKPGLVLFLCLLLVYNILIKRMIQMDKTKTVEGLLYVLAILVIINSVYALLLKLSMMLPNLGLNPTISIIGQIVIQAGYLWFVFLIVSSIFKDITNFGYNVFHTAVLSATGAVTGTLSNAKNKALYSEEQQNYMESARLKNESKGSIDSKNLLEEMSRRDKKREESSEDRAFMEEIFGDSKK